MSLLSIMTKIKHFQCYHIAKNYIYFQKVEWIVVKAKIDASTNIETPLRHVAGERMDCSCH